MYMVKGLGLEDGEYVVDYMTYAACLEIHQKHPIASACGSILTRAIQKIGPVFYKGEKPYTLSADMQKELDEHYVPCVSDIANYMLTLGLVPMKNRVVNKRIVPMVYKGTMGIDFNITVKSNGGVMEYRFYKRKKSMAWSRSLKVIVESGFGHDPTPTGRLTSVVSTLLPYAYWMERMRTYELRSGYIRSEPTLITEVTPTAAGLFTKDQKGHYADLDEGKYGERARFDLNEQVR